MASKERSDSTLGPIQINKSLKSSFKAICADRSTSMTKEIIVFIEGFVKRYRKVPDAVNPPEDKIVRTPGQTGES